MRKQRKIVFAVVMIVGISPFISFCEAQSNSCAACGNSPEKFNLINKFIRDILVDIKTIGTQAPYAGKHVPPSRFDSGQFVPPQQTTLSKSVRRARESVGSVLAVQRINRDLFVGGNIEVSLTSLRNNKVMLRDRNKTLKIEKDINKKKFELSVGGGWTDKIGGKTLEKMEKTIERYKSLGILANVTIIDGGAEYGDLILLLGQLNNATKRLILLGGEELQESEKQKLFDDRTSGEITIMIERSVISQIKEAYDCVQQYACEKSWGDSKTTLKDLGKTFKNGLTSARSEIRKANAKLVNAYSKENLKKVVKEQTLVNQISGALNDINKRTEKFSKAKDKETRREIKEAQEEMERAIKKTQSIKTTDEKGLVLDVLKQRLATTQQDVQEDASNTMKTYATQDVTNITAYFVGLSQLVNSITDNIVGNKDSDKKCLIKNLGVLCEKQCSNVGNKKCYY